MVRPRFVKLRLSSFLRSRSLSLSLSLSPRCRVSRLTRYFISHVVKTVGRVLSYKRFRRNRWKSKLEPYRSLTLIVTLEYFLYDKLRVLQTRSTNIFDRFWELIRWKVNVHFFFICFWNKCIWKNDKLRRIWYLSSSRNLLRSKKNSKKKKQIYVWNDKS